MFLRDYFIFRFTILSEVTYVLGLATSNSCIRIDNLTPRTIFSLSIFFDGTIPSLWQMMPAISSALVWPLVFLLLRAIRRSLKLT